MERDFSRYNELVKEEVNEELSISANLNLAFKTIEIIGNILKGYHTSLKADMKYELSEEAHLLGLRTIGLFFDTLNEDMDSIKERIEELIEKENAVQGFEKERIAKGFIFNMTGLISFFFIGKISSALSYNKLSETHKDVLEKHNYNSCKLINLIMELEFKKTIPLDLIRKLKEEFNKNKLAECLMKNTIIKHLYFNPIKYKEKQKVCNELGISIKDHKKLIYKNN